MIFLSFIVSWLKNHYTSEGLVLANLKFDVDLYSGVGDCWATDFREDDETRIYATTHNFRLNSEIYHDCSMIVIQVNINKTSV